MRVSESGRRGRKQLAAEARIMTIRDAAEYLHCHTSTLYRLVETGRIPAFKLGGNWRFMRSELERWISRQSVRTRLRAS